MDNLQTHQTGPRDVFLQIFNIILLYVGIFALGNLLFQIINLNFPDVLSYDWYSTDRLRWPLSFLVITVPVYIWISYYLARETEKFPVKKDLKTRRWLIYFTLFASAIAILIDLVALIYRYLGGELSSAFLLKVLVVLLMAVGIFTYYRWILNNAKPALHDPKMRWFIIGFIFLITLAIGYGFYLAGSPGAERLRRFDSQRVSDLELIQSQIIYHWQRTESLPQILDELNDPLSGYQSPRDPKTGESYKYSTTGELNFTLCATFETNVDNKESNPPLSRPYPYNNEAWLHSEGEECFERTIDPKRFPPFSREGLLPVPKF